MYPLLRCFSQNHYRLTNVNNLRLRSVRPFVNASSPKETVFSSVPSARGFSATRLGQGIKVFCGTSNPRLGEEASRRIGLEPGKMKINRFADLEIGVQIQENVRGSDCFVVQSTCTPVNDNLMEMFLIVDALKRASAERITAVIPYYGYARQDKKSKLREPISAALVAKLIEASGVDRVLTIDLHCGQIQGFFNVPVDNISAQPLICLESRDFMCNLQNVTVVSPDAGGVGRADVFRDWLDKTRGAGESANMAVMNKRRKAANEVLSVELTDDVQGSNCIIVDDMIDTAGTLVSAANVLKEKGANSIYACVTHALLNDPAVERIANSHLERVFLTDTVPISVGNEQNKLKVVSVAKLIAQAIQRTHDGQSISTLYTSYTT